MTKNTKPNFFNSPHAPRAARQPEIVDPTWDYSDVADILTELDLADAARAENAEW